MLPTRHEKGAAVETGRLDLKSPGYPKRSPTIAGRQIRMVDQIRREATDGKHVPNKENAAGNGPNGIGR